MKNLSNKVLEFEKEISEESFLEFKEDIDKIETLEDVKVYYLYKRGWEDDIDLIETLINFIIEVKDN